MPGVNSKKIMKNCLNCNKEFQDITKSHNAKCCSKRCSSAYRNSRKFDGKVEGYDFIRCPVCNQKVAEVTVLHAKMHGYEKPSDIAKEYGIRTLLCEKKIERMTGSNNPGYQHGGKLSPWSFNNLKLTKEEILENLRKTEDSRKGTRPNEIESWIKKGYNEVEAMSKVSERQRTFSLDICIEKYGEEVGKEIWASRQKKWLDSFPRLNYSKISQDLFWKIYSLMEDKSNVYFATKDPSGFKSTDDTNYELRLLLGEKTIVPDFIVTSQNKIIEFDGDYWHSEAKVNKSREESRIKILEQNNYSVLRIKEKDYNNDPQGEIKKCLNFLKK